MNKNDFRVNKNFIYIIINTGCSLSLYSVGLMILTPENKNRIFILYLDEMNFILELNSGIDVEWGRGDYQ